jgi:Asp/Glu/hydantoin racemase
MKAKGGRNVYGIAMGVLLLDTRFPRIPGDVGNASSYGFPVVFRVVRGATLKRVVFEADETLLQPFVDAALELEGMGVRAITTSCGFLVLFQDKLANTLRVPVFTSSLLMVPFAYRLTGGRVGIITANSKTLTAKHLQAAGIGQDVPVAVVGLEDKPEFSRSILQDTEEMDSDKVRAEVVDAAETLLSRYRDIKCFVFECHNLSPYGHAVNQRTGLPVFDFLAFADFVYSSVVKKTYDHIPYW